MESLMMESPFEIHRQPVPALRARQCVRRKAAYGNALGGGAGLVRRWRPSDLERHPERPDDCAGTRRPATVGVFRHPSNYSNGNTRRPAGPARHLRARRRGASRRTEYDGSITVLADSYEGKRLNWPNDVVVKSDGSIWFTDPPYGIDDGLRRAQGGDGAGRLPRLPHRSRHGAASRSSPTISTGRTASPSRRTSSCSTSPIPAAPIARTGRGTSARFTVSDDGKLSRRRGLRRRCTAGLSDGFRLDTDGRVWTSAGEGVHCFSPDGDAAR